MNEVVFVVLADEFQDCFLVGGQGTLRALFPEVEVLERMDPGCRPVYIFLYSGIQAEQLTSPVYTYLYSGIRTEQLTRERSMGVWMTNLSSHSDGNRRDMPRGSVIQRRRDIKNPSDRYG